MIRFLVIKHILRTEFDDHLFDRTIELFDTPKQCGGILDLGFDGDLTEQPDFTKTEARFFALGVELDPGKASVPDDSQVNEYGDGNSGRYEKNYPPQNYIIDSNLIYLIH